MARISTGLEVIEKARKQVREARTAGELRCAQAVVFPLDFGMSIEETSKALGISKGWTCQIRRQFILMNSMKPAVPSLPQPASNKVRNRAYMKSEEEAEFLAQFTEKAEQAGILIVSEIRLALEPVYDLRSNNVKNAKETNWRLLLSLRSQFFHNLRHFSNQAKERSTTHRFGMTAKV